MKSSREINLEKLTSDHRQALGKISDKLYDIARNVEEMGDEYEGRIHTRLDKVVLIVDDAIRTLESLQVTGERQGELL